MRFVALIMLLISSQAHAESPQQYFEGLAPAKTSFEECVDAMRNGIELFSDYDFSNPEKPASEKVYLHKDALHKVFYQGNSMGTHLHKVSCFKFEKTERRR